MFRFIHLLTLLGAIFSSSCMRNSFETWEDIKTAGHYIGRGFNALWGKDYESRMVTTDEEIISPGHGDFIPLKDSEISHARVRADTPVAQPKVIPGQKGVPVLADFYTPPQTVEALFHPVHFATDQHVIQDKAEIQSLTELAKHLKKNPKLFIVVEGHADERASASYNMALGMRRANYVRSFLVQHGADQNQIYTVSYGKERPIAMGHSKEEWKINRRSEFRIHQK